MKIKYVFLVLYTVSILFLTYLFFTISPISDPSCSGFDCLGLIIIGGLIQMIKPVILVSIILQITFYIGILFKSEWLKEHKSFSFIGFFILISPYMLVFFGLSPFLGLGK